MQKLVTKIGVIDADLIGRKNHRFPNLALMKISSFFGGAELLTSYENLELYDKIYISKVFTDTPFPEEVAKRANVVVGGTGFYFDKAPDLPFEIEHSMPDYHLYDKWLKGKPMTTAYKEYRDYSIGFMTRGCFRRCGFCVNKKYNRVQAHSPLLEFLDETRPKICLLDDNILGFKGWEKVWDELDEAGKPFKFKQGLDERLLTDEKCSRIFNSRYDGYYTFAFDNVADYELIHKKLEMIRKHTRRRNITFYVLCGYEGTDLEDITATFKRIELLMEYGCLPYIMRYQSRDAKPYEASEFRDVYITLARWCNQPSMFKKNSFVEFCELNQRQIKTEGTLCTAMRGFKKVRGQIPDKYLEMKWRAK